MWERFTYYGIQAILILFMVAAVARGGLGLDDEDLASSIYGLYLGSTYLLGLFGRLDRRPSARRTARSDQRRRTHRRRQRPAGDRQPAIFFLGLLVNAMGVGLLKPNVSAIVASLYPEGGARRDAGFSIFYMGINIGAVLGSAIVPRVRRRTSAGASGSRCRRCSWRSAWCSSCGRVPTSARQACNPRTSGAARGPRSSCSSRQSPRS